MPNDTKVENALSIFNQESSLVKYVLNPTSLIMPDGCDFTTVEKMMTGFKVVGDATKFWRGDLLVYAQRNFGEMFSQLVDESDYAYQSLRDEMWVSNAVSPTVRRAELTWSHHREVAALLKAEQIKFLQMAIDGKLTAGALKALIKGGPKEKDLAPTKAEAYAGALRAIIKNAKDSELFNEKFFDERLESAEEISPASMVVTRSAVIASDALEAYEKKA